MDKRLYQNYADSIKEALSSGERRGIEKSTDYLSADGIGKVKTHLSFINEDKSVSLFNSLRPLNGLADKKTRYNEKPGAHPDFISLKDQNRSEKHYITSVFVDIKNSTGLFKKYTPEVVAYITNTIQQAAVHTCWYFDGYIQRYHGDGLFVYFGGKLITLKESVKSAINAASFISYFIENDIKRIFSEEGVENIYTRIGIDTGNDQDVLWYQAGIKECSEITTCSLHTSLASKMQSNAVTNGIILGDNVKNYSDLDKSLFSIKKKDGKEQRYIFQIPDENFYYTQWQFDWNTHLKNIPGLTSDEEGNLYLNLSSHENINQNKLNTEFLISNVQGYRPYYR